MKESPPSMRHCKRSDLSAEALAKVEAICFLIIFSIFLFSRTSNAQEAPGKISVAQIERSLNTKILPDSACFDQKIESCPPPLIGVKISYWAPEFLMESVKAPGEYVLTDLNAEARKAELLEISRHAVQEMSQDQTMEPSSTSSYQSLDGSGMQFNEVHIFPFKPGVLLDLACPISLPNVYPFYSEKHTKSWRMGKSNRRFPKMGSWGFLFPRTGFMINPSPMTASIATCIKGVDRMHPEFGLAAGLPLAIDKVQLVYPEKSMCMGIGSDLRGLEQSFYSKDGRYVWIYWHFRKCEYCVPA